MIQRARIGLSLCLLVTATVAAAGIKGAPPGYEAQYKQVLDGKSSLVWGGAASLDTSSSNCTNTGGIFTP